MVVAGSFCSREKVCELFMLSWQCDHGAGGCSVLAVNVETEQIYVYMYVCVCSCFVSIKENIWGLNWNSVLFNFGMEDK